MTARGAYVRKTKTAPKLTVAAVDWPAILWALGAKGYKLPEIGRLLDCGHCLVRSFRDKGTEPSYTQGRLILKLADMEGIVYES